jgi:two-component system LytT family sensor kinase
MAFIRSYWYHFIFWIGYYFFWIAVYYGFYDQKIYLFLVTGLYMIIHGSNYYITQYFLIPRFLKTSRLLLFVIGLLLLIFSSVMLLYTGILLSTGEKMSTYFGTNHKMLIGSLAFSNIFVLAFVLALKSFKDRFYNTRLEEKKEKDRLQNELHFLKAQVNPHFLFNTINSIYVLIRKDPQRASDALIQLSDLLRTQLYEFSTDWIDIEKETEYIENYLKLERLRKGDRIDMDYEKSPTVIGFKVAPLMLIPFLENCFKHLASPENGRSAVKVKLDYSGKIFTAIFENTIGGHPEEASLPGGIGLNNVHRRLELLYKNKHQLEVEKSTNFYKVTLKLQIDA